jgi:hypothetical protein
MRLISEDVYDGLLKVYGAAQLFCEVTQGEMSELEGSESNSIPAEFMLLHRAVKEYEKIPR